MDKISVTAGLTEQEQNALETDLIAQHRSTLHNIKPGEFNNRFPEAGQGTNLKAALQKPAFEFTVDIVRGL